MNFQYLDNQFSETIWHQINLKTKPVGALGELEHVAHHLATLQSNRKGEFINRIEIAQPQALIFAGDHGIADEGISIAPSAVTQQMVQNFLAGGAAINCFCNVNQVDLTVVDCGILNPVESLSDMLVLQRLGQRTENFSQHAAMTLEQVEQGLLFGQKIAKQKIQLGSDILMFGEMGIGNTSSASAILGAFTQRSALECVGRGTGINDEQWQKKVELVGHAIERCKGKAPKEILSEVGGFEIVQMVGAFIAAGEAKIPVLVDGFIVTAAAYVASILSPQCRDVMIFAHQSHEAGHQYLLADLKARPLLDLSLRLGEGTGAVLAMPLIKASAEFYNNMASFEQAGVVV